MTEFPAPDSRAEVIEAYAEMLPAHSPAEIAQALALAETFHREHMNSAITAMAALCNANPEQESLLALLITTGMTNDWEARQEAASTMLLIDTLRRKTQPAAQPKQEV